jgi:hypothetical protein
MMDQTADEREGVSRRAVLTGGGAALVGGLTAAAVTAVGGAATAGATGDHAVATGPPGTTVIELVVRIAQSGRDFTGMGYLTQVAGLGDSDLFSDPAQRDEAHALFVATARGQLVARSVDGAVHALDIAGQLRVYQRSGAGAAWGNPGSFSAGRQVARFGLELQDVLTVILPNTGLPTLGGTADQTNAGSVHGTAFGRVGQTLRFTATGLGTRTDSNTDLNNAQAQLSVAGALIAV